MNRVIVIGGGPAGIFASYFASKEGAKVVLIEKNKFLGKKLRITGKGRCNITNASDIDNIISNIYNNGTFMYSSLYSFTNDDLMDLLKSFGLDLKVERGNRVFPTSDKAIDVARTLEKMIDKSKVDVMLGESVKNIIVENSILKGVLLKSGKKIYSNSIVIATGGMSYPLTGSTGDGYRFAKICGHNIMELKPSLVGLNTSPVPYSNMIGLNLRNVSISLYRNNKKIYDDFGEMEFREYGIDGPIIKSASCFVANDGAKYKIKLDLKPALSHEKLDARIQRDFHESNNVFFSEVLKKLLPSKIINFIIDYSQIYSNKVVHQITREERKKLVDLVKNVEFDIDSTRPIDEAIATSGGVSTLEINPSTMESKLVKNLFFAGEVIDVDAFTGGYNLQIAFSTGYLAGINSANKK